MLKTKIWRVTLSMLCCLMCYGAKAQGERDTLAMSLTECLQYAKDNSITLKKAKLQVDNSEADLLTAKGAFLPSVSASASQSLSSTPLNKNNSGSNTVYSGSYGVDASMTLYSGGKNKLSLSKSEISKEIDNLAISEFENSIEMTVTELYIEILYATEQIEVAENSLTLSEHNLERGKAFLDAGSINIADYALLESAVATDKYNVIVAKTQLSNMYVNLKHQLEISNSTILEVKTPAMSNDLLMSLIPSVDNIYSTAVEQRPEIKSSELSLESSELDVKIAKAAYLPTLSLSAGFGLSHNSVSDFTFTSQLRDNFSSSIGLSLSVPIFSKYVTRNTVRKSVNAVATADLQLVETQKDLYQAIETLHNNATNSQAQYAVSEYKLSAVKRSLELVTEQFKLGMKNITELLTEQDNLRTSEQDFLMNKYQLILNKALLNYYKTNVITL